MNTKQKIRELLLSSEDGMTIKQICQRLDREYHNISKLVKTMPDAYIDRYREWQTNCYEAIWCVVEVPANCPKPERKKESE